MIVQRLTHLKDWYERHERRVSAYALVTGFIFDSLTLGRVDSLWDNLWLSGNLLVAAVCIIVIHRHEHGARLHFWLSNIMQFNFGALLGASFIFYFRSAALSVSWPFLLFLLAAIFANEFFKKHYSRLVFQISFLYLSIFIFAIFLVPVLIHRIGTIPFLLSGVVSLVALWLFTKALEEFSKQTAFSVLSIFIIINVLYFTNILPPIPLALKDAGIYHELSRTPEGGYIVKENKMGWLEKLHLYKTVRWMPGETLYAYSAVFSPADLNADIIHEWQYQDKATEEWVRESRIPLKLYGGRKEGFRTYSVKSNLKPGLWRVNVSTPRGAVIGRISFRIMQSDIQPELVTLIKE